MSSILNQEFKDINKEREFRRAEDREAAWLTVRGLQFSGFAVLVYLIMDFSFGNYTLMRSVTMGAIISSCLTLSMVKKKEVLQRLQAATPLAATLVFVSSIYFGSSSNHAIDAVHFHLLMTYCALYIIRSIKWSKYYIIFGSAIFNTLQIAAHGLDSRNNIRDKIVYNTANLLIIIVLQLLLAVTYEKQRRGHFEEKLKNSALAEEYRELFMQVPVGLIIYEGEGELKYNKEVTRIFGDETSEEDITDQESIENQNLLDSLTKGSGDSLRRLTDLVTEMSTDLDHSPQDSFVRDYGEFCYDSPGAGKVKRLEIVAKSIRWNDETKILLTLKDVSIIQEAYNKVKEMDELKTKWLRTVSHEFKTPVNAITGVLDILKGGISPESENYKFIDTAQVATDLLLNYIGDLMDYFQIQTQNFETNVIKFDVMALILNSLRMLSFKAGQKSLVMCTEFNHKKYYIDVNSIRFIETEDDEECENEIFGYDSDRDENPTNESLEKLDLKILRRNSLASSLNGRPNFSVDRSSDSIDDTREHSLEMYGDPSRVQQVLLNLVGNAIKFSPKNSKITVKVSAPGADQRIKIQVIDRGMGIKSKDMDMLFKEFGRVRTEETQKLNPQGVGLGLWISKNLCQKMGGDLWVKSKYGHGSTFMFSVESRQENFREEDLMEMSTLVTSRLQKYSIADDGNGPFSLSFNMDANTQPQTFSTPTITPNPKRVKDPAKRGSYRSSHTERLIRTPTPDMLNSNPSVSIGDLETTRAMNSSDEYLRILPEVKCPATERGDGRNMTLTSTTSGGNSAASKNCTCRPVLVVDDDAINRMILTTMLEKRGLNCECASDGVEAIEMIRKRRESDCCKAFELVIMDYAMPYMNGPEATVILKKDIREGRLPCMNIVGHTAYSTEDDLQFFRKSGVVDILPKPVKQQDLARLLAKWVK